MTQQEINACVGKIFQIRDAHHLCIAAGNDALILLQLCDKDETLFKLGDPVQYVVAKHPKWYNGELVWAQGAYFPLIQYRGSNASSVDALLDAALDLSDNPLYIAMVSDDAGIRCAGVYTQQLDAEHSLEQLINVDWEIMDLIQDRGKKRLSFEEYEILRSEHSAEYDYWIEERHANQTVKE